MIYKAEMNFGKKKAAVHFIGKGRDFGMTQHQMFSVHHELMRMLKCYDEYICTSFYERNRWGGYEIVCAANCY